MIKIRAELTSSDLFVDEKQIKSNKIKEYIVVLLKESSEWNIDVTFGVFQLKVWLNDTYSSTNFDQIDVFPYVLL